MATGAPNVNGAGADAGAAPNMLLLAELSVVLVPKLNGFAASFVFPPKVNDALGAAAAAILLLLPNGDTLGGAELNAETFVADALGTVLNENGDFVSVAVGAAGAPNGDVTLEPKENVDELFPNAGGAGALVFAPALKANGVFWSFVGAANVGFAAGVLDV